MDYSLRICELCSDQFNAKNSRAGRLCPNCDSIKADVKAILNDKSISQATDDEKTRIIERVKQRRTTQKGPFFNIKDPNGKLGIQTEYEARFK